jgi:hypothetical protein
VEAAVVTVVPPVVVVLVGLVVVVALIQPVVPAFRDKATLAEQHNLHLFHQVVVVEPVVPELQVLVDNLDPEVLD